MILPQDTLLSRGQQGFESLTGYYYYINPVYMILFQVTGLFDYGTLTLTVYFNGGLLTPEESLNAIYLSPTGFQCGYIGAGPMQLSLAILMCVYPEADPETLQFTKFCRDHVSSWPLRINFSIDVEIDDGNYIEERLPF